MIKTMVTIAAAIGFAAFSLQPVLADEASLAAAKKDMLETLGPDAVENSLLPDAFFESTWAQARELWVNQSYVTDAKVRALIGLAVSSQIPCQYCIYADASEARALGVSEEEIKEAVMFAAITRLWSTILNGNQVDMAAFKAEVDATAVAIREAVAKAQ